MRTVIGGTVMDERFQRLALLVGPDKLTVLQNARVMVIGLGGVGAMAAEALARSGIGTMILIDHDKIELSNLNRQILALDTVLDQRKTDVMRERITAINPHCQVIAYDRFFDQESREILVREAPDYVIDAIDTITAKLDLITMGHELGIPVISSLGMGNRFDPTQLAYGWLADTSGDPLAKAMRIQARKRGMTYPIPVVYSREKPRSIKPYEQPDQPRVKAGSTAFVPNAAGLCLAAYVVDKLINKE